jgi:hypothetical protein
MKKSSKKGFIPFICFYLGILCIGSFFLIVEATKEEIDSLFYVGGIFIILGVLNLKL